MSDPNAPAPRGFLNWWQGLILAVCSAILGVAAAVAIMRGNSASVGNGPSWAMVLLRFVPHFLLLFGILADAFTYEGVYWTGTMVGVLATFAAPLLDKLAAGALAMIAKLFTKPGVEGAVAKGGGLLGSLAAKMKGGGDYEGCSLMSGAMTADDQKSGVPQTMTVTTSILAYYIFDLITNLSVLDATGAIVASLALFAGQAAAISGCVDSIGQAAGIAGLYGIVIGGISFGVINTWAPNYLPSSVLVGSKAASNVPNGPGRKGLGMSGGNGGGGLAGGNGNPASASTCT